MSISGESINKPQWELGIWKEMALWDSKGLNSIETTGYPLDIKTRSLPHIIHIKINSKAVKNPNEKIEHKNEGIHTFIPKQIQEVTYTGSRRKWEQDFAMYTFLVFWGNHVNV